MLLADQSVLEAGFKGITAHNRLITAPALPFSIAGDHQQPGAYITVFIINTTFLFRAKLQTFSLAKRFRVPKEIPPGMSVTRTVV